MRVNRRTRRRPPSTVAASWRAAPPPASCRRRRPALQKLLEDVKRGRVDVIVVYKVDRLTRSLADFAKLVELFDARGVSFVSVTQSFNTTTSMGRLTLNVLLSFAQFEREVTGKDSRQDRRVEEEGHMDGGRGPARLASSSQTASSGLSSPSSAPRSIKHALAQPATRCGRKPSRSPSSAFTQLPIAIVAHGNTREDVAPGPDGLLASATCMLYRAGRSRFSRYDDAAKPPHIPGNRLSSCKEDHAAKLFHKRPPWGTQSGVRRGVRRGSERPLNLLILL